MHASINQRWVTLTASSVFAVALLCLSSCVTTDSKPLPRINPVQAVTQIPTDELLDVGIRTFDPNLPSTSSMNEQTLNKRHLYPEIRQAETYYMASILRGTLESSAQWGAVRVLPESAQFVDLTVKASILESTGARLALEVTVADSRGRVWISKRRYEEPADLGTYKTDASLKARDPFQNLYSHIANDMVAARALLGTDEKREIRRVTELRFAHDLAPAVTDGYLTANETGLITVARLPAKDDPFSARIARIRERDAAVVDTVNGYYSNFADQMQASYGAWRRASYEELEKESRTRNQARTRTVLGAAAVLASIFAPGGCRSTDYSCRRLQGAARTAGAIGGTAAVLSGLKKYSDAKVHTQALQELADTFKSEVASQVVEVEGRTLKLTGTADEQYREWRKLLQELYLEESTTSPAAAPAAPQAAVSASPAA